MGNTKRKRSKAVNITPWSKCGLSLKNWKEMLSTIAYDITEPENVVGLKGLASHGQVWEDWFDAYLNGPLKQKFWSVSSEHAFTFARDVKMISSVIRPFVMKAAREARRSVATVPVEEVPIEPSTSKNHNRFHVLEDLEREDRIPEAMAISAANEELNRNQSPDIILSHSLDSEKDGQQQPNESPCVRAILRSNLKKRTRPVQDPGEACTVAPLNQTMKDYIDKNKGDCDIIQRGNEVSECYTHPPGDDGDKASPAWRQLESLDTILLQHHRPPSNGLHPHQNEPSPMRDLEYTIVNSPYSKTKPGDWEKVSSTIFDWHSHADKNEETHVRKRCKVNERPITSAVSEKLNNTCHPERSVTLGGGEPSKPIQNVPGLGWIAGELQTSPEIPRQAVICEGTSIISAAPLSPLMESNDNRNSTRLVPSRHIQILQGLENVAHLPHISPLAVVDPNTPSQASNFRGTPIPGDDQEEAQTPKKKAPATVAGSEVFHDRPKDITNRADCQNPQPLEVTHNLQGNEHEDPVAAAATLRIASYLMPYGRQGYFPPFVFASAGASKQLGTKFDYRFHYWAHPPSISTFLQDLYAKHQISLQSHLTSLKLIMEGDTLHVEVGRYQGSWDWHIAMDIAMHRNCWVEVIFETE